MMVLVDIYILKNFQEQLLNNIALKGVKNINKVILRKITDNIGSTRSSIIFYTIKFNQNKFIYSSSIVLGGFEVIS